MSDHAGERSEEATPRRRQEARREGQVAKSADLTAALGLLLGAGALAVLAASAPAHLLALARRIWSGAGAGTAAAPALLDAAAVAARVAVPVIAASAIAGVLVTLAQVGPVFAPKVLRPDFSRIDPAAGLKRMFSTQRLMVVVRAAVALLLAATVTAALTHGQARSLLTLPHATPAHLTAFLGTHLTAVIAACGLVLLVPGALDLWLAHRRLAKDLRMSRQQVKDEHKRDEGDPMLKGQRRQAQRELSASPVPALKEARVLVVNPTHIAVAIHHGASLPVPLVGVRGREADAARLRAEARALGIPIVRDVPLARALVCVDPGRPVPEPLFGAVAAVLATVYRASLRAADGPSAVRRRSS
jgi:flagellar biosynthesis protein FlhB